MSTDVGDDLPIATPPCQVCGGCGVSWPAGKDLPAVFICDGCLCASTMSLGFVCATCGRNTREYGLFAKALHICSRCVALISHGQPPREFFCTKFVDVAPAGGVISCGAPASWVGIHRVNIQGTGTPFDPRRKYVLSFYCSMCWVTEAGEVIQPRKLPLPPA